MCELDYKVNMTLTVTHIIFEVKELTQVINIVASYSSGVATVGHGWAHAHPNLARTAREICTNSKFFWRIEGGVADSA